MLSWWQDLSARERVLLIAGGGVLGVFFIYWGVFSPLMGWASRADARAQSAEAGYELVIKAAAIGQSAQQSKQKMPLYSAINRTAAQAQIEILRIGDVVNGEIEVSVGQVSAGQLYAWFGQLQRQFGITLIYADISRTTDETVSAQILTFKAPAE